MAYQPKSYRKFLATAVTAALVTTVAAPAVTQVSAASNTSFPDVASSHWAADAIAYLVDKGALEGRPGGKFDPNANVTRAEAAKILAITLGLEVDAKAKTDFSDAKDHWASSYIAAIQAQTEDVINGFPNGTFKPNANITRQDLAKMIVTAYELEANEDSNVNFTDNTGYGAEFVKTLASLGIVEGMSEGKFVPQNNVTRAQIPVFVHRSEVEAVRVTPNTPAEFAITSVTALDDTNRFLQIDFNKRVNSLETSDIAIQDAKSLERYGVKAVTLSSNGMTAQVELFAADSGYQILKDLTDYKVTVKANGKVLEYTFNRPAFIEHRVVDINVIDRQITVFTKTGSTLTLKVPTDVKDFDYQTVLGEKVSIWYNKDNEVVNFKIADETAKYDAIEITKVNEVKLLTTDKKYDLSKESFENDKDVKTFAFYVDGKRVDKDGEIPASYINNKYNHAKVGYNKSGDIEYISAYNLNYFLVVDKVSGNEVVGYAGEGTGGAFNAKDATIIKDGKVIALADLAQGDVLFFNTTLKDKEKFAEVLTNTVSGKIDSVFSDSVRIDGKTYKFKNNSDLDKFDVDYAQGAVYLNDDNETEFVDSDAAEELQAAGPVTLYSDHAGNVVYISGDTANVERNTVTSILTSNINAYNQGNRDRIEVEAKFSTGEEKLFDVNLKDLKSIIVDGKTYDIDNDAKTKWTAKLGGTNDSEIHLTDNTKPTSQTPVKVTVTQTNGDVVKLHLNSDRNRLEKLEFYVDRSIDTTSIIEAGDSYVAGKKLNSKTIVFDAKKFTNNAKDISITTWGEYNGSDISDATVVFDKDNEVTALVINDTTGAGDKLEEAVITNVLRNTDGDIVELTAFISGVKRTIAVDEVTANSLERGNVAVLVFDDKNMDLVEDIITTDDFAGNNKLGSNYAFKGNVADNAVNVGKREVTITGGDTYRLANDGLVIDASNKSDIKDKSLTDLRGKNNVTFILDEKDSRFVKFIVIGAKADNITDSATKVASVNAIGDINVPFGATIASANLPTSVGVTYDNGTAANVNVTWDTTSYNANAAATYTFAGTLTLPTGISADGKAASVKVIVGAASTNANVTSADYTVSETGSTGTITGVTGTVTKADFLAKLTKDTNATWDDAGLTDPIASGDTLVVTAQDGTTKVTYTITVTP